MGIIHKSLSINPEQTIISIFHDRRNPGAAPVLDNLPRLGEIPHLAVESTHEGWIDGLEDRESLISDPVALIFRHGICAVLPVWDLIGEHVAFYLLSRAVQKRTQKRNRRKARNRRDN